METQSLICCQLNLVVHMTENNPMVSNQNMGVTPDIDVYIAKHSLAIDRFSNFTKATTAILLCITRKSTPP